MEKVSGKRHFVLVHGAWHGAWCWYKLAALLESAGQLVTVMDLAASGVHPKRLDEVGSLREYVEPLLETMAALPPGERVVLVSHSLGGMGISLAMEAFPEKVAAGVFVAAFMPAPHSPASQPPAFDLFAEIFSTDPMGTMMDCEIQLDENNYPSSVKMGPRFLSSKFYQCCSPEDVMLAMLLVRPSKLFAKELEEEMVTEERFGSVARVYIVCKEDEIIKEDLQRWIIERASVNEVKEIESADHMAMLSKPRELLNILSVVAEIYC